MLNMLIYNKLYQQYIKEATPEALFQVRKYLDHNNCLMSPPKYRYKEEDIHTWKYLDGKVSYNDKTEKYRYTNVYNPNFKFGHLV